MTELWLGGSIVSEDPFVVYSTRGTGAAFGIASLFQDYFTKKPALHLISFTWTMEQGNLQWLMRDLDRLQEQLPHNRFAFLCNTEMEAYAFSRAGLPAFVASAAMFIDETVFQVHAKPAEPRFDAVYLARLTPFKRHELAANVPRLGLVYGPAYEGTPILYDETRSVLPHAYFANHDMGGGKYLKLSRLECMALLNASRTGLALSAEEGVMRAVIEYLLCGLPVVSTRAKGGRERYLQPPYATLVPDDPAAVAAAVRAFVEEPLPRQEVRNYILNILNFERHCFLLALNALVKDVFGVSDRFSEIPKNLCGSDRFRPSSAIKADLDRLLPLGR